MKYIFLSMLSILLLIALVGCSVSVSNVDKHSYNYNQPNQSNNTLYSNHVSNYNKQTGIKSQSFSDNTGYNDFITSPNNTQSKNYSNNSKPVVSSDKKSPSTTKPTTSSTKKAEQTKPIIKGSMKGVWLSCFNFDSLIKNCHTKSEAEFVVNTIMDNIKSFGFNSVFMHVRSHSNAYYAKSKFPYAASVKNLITNHNFDPLGYAIDSAHKRGIALHAWINPYRIGPATNSKPDDGTFQAKFFGSNYLFYDPAANSTNKIINDAIKEVVSGYNVDGVHFDDYFYPSDPAALPTNGPASFEKNNFNKTSGGKSISQWRTDNINRMVKSAYNTVKSIKKDCVFGISPAANMSNNENKMYADVKLWMSTPGYVDYISPQIYFGFEHSTAAFDKKLTEWLSYPRHSSVSMIPGLSITKSGSVDEYAGVGKNEWINNTDIAKRSVEHLSTVSEVSGLIYYNYSSFLSTSSNMKKEVENLLPVLKEYGLHKE